ncbi:MAG: Gfo/Idh/MocA family protein [Vulcanimicrobiaceae bacterium]
MPIRVGIVGCGFGCEVQIPALRRDGRVEVRAIAARQRSSAQAAGEKMGVPLAFEGWESLVASEEVDAVVIATVPSVQAKVARAALARGKPVLAEKPLAASLREAADMVQAAERAQLPAMIDFNFPELGAFSVARQILRRGEIGALRHVMVQWNVESRVNAGRFEHWKASRDEGGGTLFNFVSHSFYYLEWLAGRIVRLQAQLSKMPGDGRSGDAFTALSFEFEDGAAGSIAMAASSYCGLGHRIELYGDDGALILENLTSDYMRGFTLRQARRPGKLESIEFPSDNDHGSDSRIAPTASLDRRFIDWIANGTAARPSFQDGLRVQTLLDFALASDREGCRVTV